MNIQLFIRYMIPAIQNLKVQLPAKEKVGFICSLSSPNTTLIQFPRKVM